MTTQATGSAPQGDGGQQGSQQAANSPWYGSFAADAPQEFQQWVGTKNFGDAQAALQSAWNLEKLIGADRAGRTVVLPKDANDAESLKAFRAKIGVPATADDYKLPVPDGQDPGLAKFMSGVFHEAGIPASAAHTITQKWNEHISSLVEADMQRVQVENTRALESLKGEWGDQFGVKEEQALRFLKIEGWDDAKIQRYEQAFGRAQMLRDFAGMGARIGNDTLAGGNQGSNFGAGKADAQAKLNELRMKRLEGTIDEATYLSEADRLGRVLAA